MNFKDCIQFDNNIGKISVKIVPNSSKNMFIGLMKDGNYKIKLMALPEKNKANKELIEEYSKVLFKKLRRKGKTLDDVKRLLRGRDYFGSMMVENGDADCMLSGYSKSYPSVFIPLKCH